MLIQNNALNIWLNKILPNHGYNITKLAGDASVRQYYRITFDEQSRILMDSSFDKEAFEKFIKISNELNYWNLPAPKIYAKNDEESYALLEDFGDNLLLDTINNDNISQLYQNAIDIVIQMQSISKNNNIPEFDASKISTELNLFNEWFLNEYLQLDLSNAEKQVISKSFNSIIDIVLSLPKCFSHMDYHSRNIMVLEKDNLGIIDYQDAKFAPFTYDLVSILKDCYIKLPQNTVVELLDYFYINSHISKALTKSDFVRAFDICGLQRHIKVLGIFSRLHIRDNKARYLKDIPLVLSYTLECLAKYTEFSNLYEIMYKLEPNVLV